MRAPKRWRSYATAILLPAWCWLIFSGCEMFSDGLTRPTSTAAALANPMKAVGGIGIVFIPPGADAAWTRAQLAKASLPELTAYYAPVFVQQRIRPTAQRFPYPQENDVIGEARVIRDANGKLRSFAAGPPRVYSIAQTRTIGGHDHVQLTYTAWYPAHPRMKTIDLDQTDLDSCVVRITLDSEHAPLFFETLTGGSFHKVFVERWLEDEAARAFKSTPNGKKYAVEPVRKAAIDWEAAGVVEEPRNEPRRPVVFLRAGDHQVIVLGSTARLHQPPGPDVREYQLADYADLYSLPVQGCNEKAPFFQKAEGAGHSLMSLIGVGGAGQQSGSDEIKLHFDQTTWSDRTIYERGLRLPPGTL